MGSGGPVLLDTLSTPDQGALYVASFAGPMRTFPTPEGVRLFLPSRAEENRLHIVESETSFMDAVIVTSPADWQRTTPALSTVAIPVSFDVHATTLVTSCVD